MTEWHPEPDQLVALALAEPDAEAQERLVAHLAGCPTCRDESAQLSDGLQQALAATPAVAPSAGFSGRVLVAMGSTTAATPIRRRRSTLLMVACLLVGLLAGIGGVLGINAWLDRNASVTATHEPVAARLLTSSGDAIGSVGIARRSGRTFLLLNVTAGKSGARYDCILVASDGSRLNGGTWTLSDEYGRGAASGAWLVPISGEPPVAVELVTPNGTVWARGAF